MKSKPKSFIKHIAFNILMFIGDAILAILFILGLAWTLSIFGLIAIMHWFIEGNNGLAWSMIIIDIVILIYIIYIKYIDYEKDNN